MKTKCIRPVSDLQYSIDEISKTVHETAQPVYLTKNGYTDMVILSAEAFEDMQLAEDDFEKSEEFQKYLEEKLLEAAAEAKNPNTRYYTPEEAAQIMEEAIRKCTE
ncbi:MAG: type II toxin-antitoxin system Phd/YefM family antitoxin [Chitinispirillia bacterium]|nr:type II toxin-antitoxin system Phd/YefM family antitoxin [Chitinispirillia bacterium]